MAQSSNLHKGHRNRVRDRLIREGLSSFQPHEVLEYLLFHTVPQRDTNPIAHELINTFGSFEAVLDASVDELVERGHVSKNTAVFLSSLTEVFSYYENCAKSITTFNSPEKMISLFKSYYIGVKNEKLVFAFLDSGLRLKDVIEFTEGQENGLNFNVKDVLKKAVSSGAYYVAMAHNHPTSFADPSRSDVNATLELKNQLEQIDVKLLDHIIFGVSPQPLSFANSKIYYCYVSGSEQ